MTSSTGHSSLCQALSTPLLSTGEPDTIPANLPGLIRLAKGVLQAPVLVLLGCPRAKLIALLGPPEHPDQPGPKYQTEPPYRVDQVEKGSQKCPFSYFPVS